MGNGVQQQGVQALDARLAALDASAIIAWAVQEFGPGMTFANSFGAEDVVVLDLLLTEAPTAPVFLLDTGRLPQETYDLITLLQARYGRTFAVYTPQTEALQALLTTDGPNSFYQSPAARVACCQVRKIEPLARALAGKAAWLTGMRRAQGVTRTCLPVVEVDAVHGGILKLNPLADWTTDAVWTYLRAHALPYNALHDRGYPSIGCAPCTRAVAPGDDLRAGRWWWEIPEKRECGLHAR
jgi:phosphoadenosine phosphosulfate reductase